MMTNREDQSQLNTINSIPGGAEAECVSPAPRVSPSGADLDAGGPKLASYPSAPAPEIGKVSIVAR